MGRKRATRQAASEKSTGPNPASDATTTPTPVDPQASARENASATVAAMRNSLTRLHKNRLRYLQRQIEEFYGPLDSIVSQILVANRVRSHLAEQNLAAEIMGKVDAFLHEHYFRDLHQKISDILSSKLYLVEGVELPASFYVYLQHAMQEKVQLDLWRNLQVDTSRLKGIPFPEQFSQDIRSGLAQKMREYDAALRELTLLAKDTEESGNEASQASPEPGLPSQETK